MLYKNRENDAFKLVTAVQRWREYIFLLLIAFLGPLVVQSREEIEWGQLGSVITVWS